MTFIRHKLLIVDDEPDILEFLKHLLEMNDYDVVSVSDGAQVFDMAINERPDLIILDMMLPNKDGWQVQDELQADDRTRNIPVIVLTAKDLTITKMINQQIYRVSEFIAKPFNPSYLLERLREILNTPAVY